MRPRPAIIRPLLGLAVLLAVIAGWFAVANPSISGTSRGDSYTCAAPYDTVLNGEDNVPGGEPPADGDDIAAACTAVGEDRFATAVGAGVAASLALLGGLMVALLSRGRRS